MVRATFHASYLRSAAASVQYAGFEIKAQCAFDCWRKSVLPESGYLYAPCEL